MKAFEPFLKQFVDLSEHSVKETTISTMVERNIETIYNACNIPVSHTGHFHHENWINNLHGNKTSGILKAEKYTEKEKKITPRKCKWMNISSVKAFTNLEGKVLQAIALLFLAD